MPVTHGVAGSSPVQTAENYEKRLCVVREGKPCLQPVRSFPVKRGAFFVVRHLYGYSNLKAKTSQALLIQEQGHEF